MRMLLKVNIPTPNGNDGIRTGAIPGKLKQILAELEPEAAYFAEDDGERTGYIFLDMQESSEIPKIFEPFFLAFNARVTIRPAMTPADLEKAMPAIERAVKTYG